MPEPYIHTLIVPVAAIDPNGHANNVEYVRWMQDAAVAHARAVGCLDRIEQTGHTWVVRSHHVEYLSPALEGQAIEVRTWVESMGKVSSLRRYEIVRPADDTMLARGQTDWVFLDVKRGRPTRIPPEVATMFLE